MADQRSQAILDRILDPVGRCLTPEAARRLLDLRADAVAQARIEELAQKSTAGTLDADEQGEYQAYVAAASVVAVLQAKARKLLTTPSAA